MLNRRVLITGVSIAGPALAFWMHRLGWQVVLLERAPAFRAGGQNIDVRGPGRDVLARMGLLEAVQAKNTTEQAWTFVDADNNVIARFDKDGFGGEGPTAELEILRGDLACILYGAAQDVEHRFGDRIAALEDDGAGVDVTFDHGGTERFDLVVSAEGVGSSTRELVWGDDARVEPFGLSSAYFTIPKGHGDGEDARWFNAPGGRSVFLRPDPQGTTRVVMSVRQDPRGWDELSPKDQKRVLIERFADAGWETSRVLEELKATKDFYFHSIALVKVDAFHRGRVALTGDAAWALMGRGTTLALIGPYVLAGELARSGDVAMALEGYERVMRPFAETAQDVPSWGPKALQPQTRFGIRVQHAVLKLIAAPGIRALASRFAPTGDALPPLPDYPELRSPAEKRAALPAATAKKQPAKVEPVGINWAGWSLAAGVGVLAFAGLRRTRRLAVVPPDLRSPVLLVPMTTSARTLPLFRKGQALAPKPKVPGDVRIAEHRLPRTSGEAGVRVLTFERSATTAGRRPAMLWLHGGGYVMGEPEQDMALVGRILDRLDAVIVSVDYRLAPEHPFPAALDDAYAALAWLADRAPELRVDPARTAIGGQSAGGGLAAALVQRAVDQGPVRPAFQLLMYPMLDAATTRRPEFGDQGQFVWTPASNRFGWRSYLGRDPQRGDYPAYAVPAARPDLGGMPPAWIGVGTLDLFYDEDVAYGQRLAEAGVSCDLCIVEGGYHAFDLFRSGAARSRDFQEAMITALSGGVGP